MRLRLLSDLHLEVAPLEALPAGDCDVLVLAGDIDNGCAGLTWAAQMRDRLGCETLYVPGNHEFYGHEHARLRDALREQASALQIHLLDDACCTLGGIRFAGTTLWTDFAVNGRDSQAAAMALAAQRINDYREIRFDAHRTLVPADTLTLHRQACRFLRQALDDPAPCVVVSHHLPHPRSIPARFVGSALAPAFVSDLGSLMAESGVRLWLHGHAHDSADYIEGGCRVVCNPRGYRTRAGDENSAFDAGLTIDLGDLPTGTVADG